MQKFIAVIDIISFFINQRGDCQYGFVYQIYLDTKLPIDISTTPFEMLFRLLFCILQWFVFGWSKIRWTKLAPMSQHIAESAISHKGTCTARLRVEHLSSFPYWSHLYTLSVTARKSGILGGGLCRSKLGPKSVQRCTIQQLHGFIIPDETRQYWSEALNHRRNSSNWIKNCR